MSGAKARRGREPLPKWYGLPNVTITPDPVPTVRKLRSIPALRKFKVVLVTDRKDLQRQLSATATLTGETVEVADSAAGIRTLAKRKGPGLVFATIQKYRDPDTAGEAPLTADELPGARETPPGYRAGSAFEVLNDDDDITGGRTTTIAFAITGLIRA